MAVELEEYSDGTFTIFLVSGDTTFGIEGEWGMEPKDWELEWVQVKIDDEVFERENMEDSLLFLPTLIDIILKTPVTQWSWNDTA